MPSFFKRSLTCAAFLAVLLVSSAALAQDGSSGVKKPWDVTLGAGAAFTPTYEGSNRYHLMAVPLVNIVYNDMISLSARGLDAYWRTGDLRLGAGLVYNGGRSDHDSDFFTSGDDRLRGMGDIDPALGLKAFASYHLWMMDLSAAVTKYTGSDNDGVVVDLGLAVPYKLTKQLTLTPHAGATWANDDYTQTFFGVTGSQSARSGFARYDADSGFKDISVGIDANYSFDEHWFLSMRTNVKQLVGDAADSPLSYSDNSVSLATLLGYRF